MTRLVFLLLLLSFVKPANTAFYAPGETKCRLLSFTGTIRSDRTELQWIIAENARASRFEVEKSTDGKTFSIAALVFSSEKTDEDHYRYSEKHDGKKMFYRVRIIGSDGSVQLSAVLEIDPSAKPEPAEQTKLGSYAHYC